MTLMTVNEVAQMLRLAPSTIYDMERRGVIPSVRIGERVVRFLAEDIEQLVRGKRDGEDR